jgi:hypothetical protein
MEPHRHLLLEGELKTNVKSRDGKHDCDYILVFNDCFAFLGEAKNTKQIEMTLKFDICWIREGSEGQSHFLSLSFVSFQKHYHLFESFQFYDLKLSDCSATIEVVTPENVVQITTTKESKKMWFEEIDKAVKDWLARRKMLLGM